MARAFIGLGSNLGDRLALLRSALARLRAEPGVRLVACSPVYASAPLGPITDQPEFLNAACELETTLAPRALLDRLLAIEVALGRRRRLPQGPRLIDLDLLLYDDRRIAEPGLTVPHPRLHERAFVLVPLCDLDPGLVQPATGEPLRALRERLGGQALARFAPAAALE